MSAGGVCAGAARAAARKKAAIRGANNSFFISGSSSPVEGKTAVKGKAAEGRPLGSHARPLAGDLFQLFRVDVEIGIDVLHVIVVFESLKQAHHRRGGGPFRFCVGGGDHGVSGIHGFEAATANDLRHSLEEM